MAKAEPQELRWELRIGSAQEALSPLSEVSEVSAPDEEVRCFSSEVRSAEDKKEWGSQSDQGAWPRHAPRPMAGVVPSIPGMPGTS